LVRQSLIWRPIVGVDRGSNLFDGSIIASASLPRSRKTMVVSLQAVDSCEVKEIVET
jgi:hypothetical protein